jgi:hypothetical protein
MTVGRDPVTRDDVVRAILGFTVRPREPGAPG